MSKTTKRKHVLFEIQQDVFEPPRANQQITKVIASRGNNLHEVESGDGEKFLVSMPTKFRRNVWIKRGNYVLVESITEGLKVKAEIIKILTKEDVKYYKSCNLWPKKFDSADTIVPNNSDENGIVKNTNRLIYEDDSSIDEAEDDSSSDESEDDSEMDESD